MDIHNNLYQRGLIRKINKDYAYWSEVKYKVPTEFKHVLTPVDLWSIVKEDRLHDRRYFEIGNQGFYFTRADSLEQQLHEFDLHLAGAPGEQATATNEGDKYQYLIGSIMEESIASSQIEGAVTSRLVAKEMLRKNRPPRNTSERMIVNNYSTIQHIVQIKKEPLTKAGLLKLHQLITNDTLDRPDEAGLLRSNDDIYVIDAVNGDVIHTPPSHSTLPTFVSDLCRFFNDETPDFFVHPIVKASIIHFLIGYFHPFTDGNGRTARALFYWYLLRKGYWLTEYLSISRIIMKSRGQYYKAFQHTEADENDLTYFVLYQVKTLSQAYDGLKKYIDRKNQEKRQLLDLQRTEKLSPRQAQITEWLWRSPSGTLSIKEVETRMGVSNQTARNDIRALVKAGFLEELPINGKERHYIQGERMVRKP
ncbi:cell filamentation protein Fic [Spirosoma pollinicola]|uniref:Cell filamentation protein Fic n=2 Tax=Spirosoma pollinicola TaxID=2057025 RepID=A0A2K8ZC52_9BACT|nr:cell filamentation protein Fic [Spirosoma pollinicola]